MAPNLNPAGAQRRNNDLLSLKRHLDVVAAGKVEQANAALTKLMLICISWIKGETDALPYHFHISISSYKLDPLEARTPSKK